MLYDISFQKLLTEWSSKKTPDAGTETVKLAHVGTRLQCLASRCMKSESWTSMMIDRHLHTSGVCAPACNACRPA